MPTLVITVNGPFAYVTDPHNKKKLALMAPMCPQHLGVISGIETGNQFVIDKYNRRNHKANYGNCQSYRYDLDFDHKAPMPPFDGSFLPCTPPSKKFHPKEWRFWLSLPWPNTIVPVDPVTAQIIKKGKSGKKSSYAIGARLIYTDWDGNPIPLLREGTPVIRKGSPVKFAFPIGEYDDHAYLDIDFSSPLRDDPDHEDAVSCFEHLMNALGLDWSMYIDSADHPLESSKLNDCRAAVAWIG